MDHRHQSDLCEGIVTAPQMKGKGEEKKALTGSVGRNYLSARLEQAFFGSSGQCRRCRL
jgi:hypothetical protein